MQVGHTVFLLKNLCSFFTVDALFDIFPLRLPNSLSFLLAPINVSCSLIKSSIVPSMAKFDILQPSDSKLNVSIFFF